MTHDETTLQAAIDAAFLTNGDKHNGNLMTDKDHYAWSMQDSGRLAVAKAFLAFLAALQPAEQSAFEQPAPDERSLGQVAFEAFGYTHSWDVSTRQGDWQRAAQAIVEAVRGNQHAEIEKLEEKLAQTQKYLVEANRGAQRNAHINQSLAAKLNEALKRAEKAKANSAPAEAATFEAHGKTWIKSDTKPENDNAPIEWILADELNGCQPYKSDFISTSKRLGTWIGIAGWRYADEPAPESAQPWTPAVGDVVRLKSGGLNMTVKDITSDGLASCIWFDPNGQYDQTTMPASCLELVRKEMP